MKTVLVVEDNEINWKVFERILTRRGGLLAKHTEDVETVMQIAESQQADIILIAISLSNSFYQGTAVDGIKITQLLKQNPKTAHLPVILVTAHGSNWDRDYYIKCSGADGYISKPIVDHKAFLAEIYDRLTNQDPIAFNSICLASS